MYGKIQQFLQSELQTIEDNGIFKKERIITSPQGAEITVNGETVLNFCSNNYLGLSSHPEVIQAAKEEHPWARRRPPARTACAESGEGGGGAQT